MIDGSLRFEKLRGLASSRKASFNDAPLRCSVERADANFVKAAGAGTFLCA